jgi:hypothetical protein
LSGGRKLLILLPLFLPFRGYELSRRPRNPGEIAMVFRRVTHRSHLAQSTAWAAKEWAAPAGDRLGELLRPYLQPGESLPDVVLLQELVGRLLKDRGATLLGRGSRQVDSQLLTRQLRSNRDLAAEALRASLRSARFYFDAVRGRGYGASLGLGHGLSRLRPPFLTRLGGEIALHLDAEAAKASATRDTGLADPAQLATLLRERVKQLESVLARLYPEKAGHTMAVGEKRRSLTETEKIVRNAAAFLGGLYKLSDLPHLAASVRPRFRTRPRRKPAEAEAASFEEKPPAFHEPEPAPAQGGLPERPQFLRLGVRGAQLDELAPEPRERKVQTIAVVRKPLKDAGKK